MATTLEGIVTEIQSGTRFTNSVRRVTITVNSEGFSKSLMIQDPEDVYFIDRTVFLTIETPTEHYSRERREQKEKELAGLAADLKADYTDRAMEPDLDDIQER